MAVDSETDCRDGSVADGGIGNVAARGRRIATATVTVMLQFGLLKPNIKRKKKQQQQQEEE